MVRDLLHCIYYNSDMQLFRNLNYPENTALCIFEHWHATSFILEIDENYCIAYLATPKCIWKLLHCMSCNTNMQLFHYFLSWKYRTAYTETLTYNFCHAGNIWKLLAYIATLKCNFSSNINIWKLLHCIYCKTHIQLFQNIL